MILLTVGTQLPFDRLVRLVDEIAPRISDKITAQIGRGNYVPRNMAYERFIDAVQFEALMSSVTLIVAHAGIGTVMTARRHRKPLVVFPRLASLEEHRNDHQLATASALVGRKGINIASTPEDLESLLRVPPTELPQSGELNGQRRLCAEISKFIEGGRVLS